MVAVVSLAAVSVLLASPPPDAHKAPEVVGGGGTGIGVARIADPASPEQRALAEQRKAAAAVEKELKLIRSKYFRSTRNTEIRQVGISKLAKFDDPAVFPLLIELFKDEDEDARRAVIDHLASLKDDSADASIAWSAVFDKSKSFRAELARRVGRIAAEREAVSNRVKSVVATGLRSRKDDTVAAAANLANILGLYEAIPMLISAQVVGGGGGASDGGDRSLAYILVGSQVAFVSDLQPVVGDSAVAFDPTVSVATEGVILRVIDAYVVTYRVDVHNALVDLSTRGWGGRSTASLGWDTAKWREWYATEFLPHRERNPE